MALPSSSVFVSGVYKGTWTQTVNGYVHRLYYTEDGYGFTQDIKVEDVLADITGDVPIVGVYRGKTTEITCTLLSYEEAVYHANSTATAPPTYSYSQAAYGLIFGHDTADPGNMSYIGQLEHEVAGGLLQLEPAYLYANTRTFTFIAKSAVPQPKSFNLNNKIGKFQLTFKLYPYWDSSNACWRTFEITGAQS